MSGNYFNLYVDFLKKFFKIKKPLGVVFDCSSGTAGLVLERLRVKGLRVKVINGRPDGNFPVHSPNPLVQGALDQIKRQVLSQKADLGIIFDADADRAFFIDNRGRFVEPDVIAYLLFWHLRPKKGIIDVRTGWLIKKSLISDFALGGEISLTESKVGHYFIKKMMRKLKAEFSAEPSGHYYFKNFFYLDSGLMAAIEVMNAVSILPYGLADFADLLPVYYRSRECNFTVKNPARLLKFIENKYRRSALNIYYLDGLTMEFNSPAGEWWFNLRSSNTEPLIRLNLESANLRLFKNKLAEIKKLMFNSF